MSNTSTEDHRRAASERGPVPIAVVTVSDTRTPQTDVNGAFLRERIESNGHRLFGYRVIPDDPEPVVAAARELAGPENARIVIFNGGTGISKRDNTFDALAGLLEKTLPGFGELFRMLSWEQVGSAAMLSRATAGTFQGSVLISTPGSPAAVRLAWERLIEPELEHLAWELTR
jgi:molybdopterin adenylyltransferase